MKFTDKTVTQSKPELPEGKTDHIFFDDLDRGFGLRVRDTGSKIWVYQYSRNNKTRRMTIGVFPTMSPSQAREQVRKLTAERRLSADPARDLAAKQIDKESFAETVAQYLAAKQPELRDRTYTEAERYLKGTASRLNSRPLALITQSEIADLLDHTATKSGDATYNRLRANLAAMFTWAMQRGEVAGVMAQRSEIEGALKEHRREYRIVAMPTPGLLISSWSPGMAVKKDARDLADALESIADAMIHDGSFAALFAKYGLTYTPPHE